MRCTKLEVTILLGVGVFLIGTISLVTVTVRKVFPAREEQSLKAINCTIASGNMESKAKCQRKARDDSTYPCLRVYVLCGKDAKRNDSLAKMQPQLLRKDFHSLQKQVCTYLFSLCLRKFCAVKTGFFRSIFKTFENFSCPGGEKSHFLYVSAVNIILQKSSSFTVVMLQFEI